MSVLDAARLRTFSNKSAFDDVSFAFDDVSFAFDDVSPLTLDVSPSTLDVSSVLNDVSPLTLSLSPSLDDLSSSFDDLSLRMSLACPSIFPSNSCRSASIALLCEVVVSGPELVSVRRPGFEGTAGR